MASAAIAVTAAADAAPCGGSGASLETLLASFLPNWKSLVEPAIMPLTTDFLPSPQELRANFAETVYSLVLPQPTADELALFALSGGDEAGAAADAGAARAPSAEPTATHPSPDDARHENLAPRA